MIFVCGARDSGNSRSVWAYSDAGALSWSYDTGAATYGIVSDGNNNVYVVGTAADNGDGNGTRNVWKLNNAGDYLTGSYVLSNANAWSIDIDDDYVYISTSAGAVRTNHSFGSSSTIVGGSSALQAIKVDTSGNVYIGGGGTPATLRKYNSSLALQWSEDTNDSCTSIDILSGSDVIIGTSDGEIRYYKADGTSPNAGDWAVVVDGSGVNIKVAIDSNDNIYGVRYNDAGGSNKRFIHLNTSGTEQGSITTASGDLEAIMVTSDDSVYVGGDVISSKNIWSVDTTAYTLTGVADTTITPVRGLSGNGLSGSFFPVDKTYSKKAVAIANNQVWYESSAGTMSILSDASDDIDTTKALTAVWAFQKLFIANTTNLKVADFINTKITTSDLNTHAPDPGTVLTGGSSTAKMVVDYITSVTADAACTIYGKRTTTATFTSGETVTGTDDDDNTVTFATSAAETAPPHWYDWTVFGNDTTNYGTMPDSAYLVCRYRGRLILSGNPDYPYQWYMSNISFPFNFLYGTNDPMTAVAGTNADAGEIGDIVRALIPFGDDYLEFACANSIHLLDGDPASGGSIDELDNKTGIFGPWAWCIDGLGDLWFYGTGGLYKMIGGRSRPLNVSQAHLPQLVDNWAAVPGTHRVVLTYDPFRNGVIISRTTLSDGTNLNYWYDLKTEGFYPETYPTACGIFSSAYYDSDAAATKGMVLGCNDGYIRNFYNADKDDDTGASSTSAISSYATWPIEHLAEDNDREGKLTSLTVELAGGGGKGDFGDSDGVSYALYRGKDAETTLEKIKPATAWATSTAYIVGDIVTYSSIEYVCVVAHTSDESGPPYEEPDTNTTNWEAAIFASGTLTGTGRQNRIRKKVRGAYFGLKLYNSTASKTWAVNRVFGEIKPSGRIRG